MSKKIRVLAGIAAIWLGLMMFMGVGARRSMHAHAHFARSAERAELHAEAAEARGETVAGDSAENAQSNRYSHRHHRGGHGLLGGLIHLIALGFIIKLVLDALRKRRGQHHGDMKAESPDEDLSNEIRVGDEINRDEQPAAATTVDVDDLTVDDLLHAMKRLGIKKLEL